MTTLSLRDANINSLMDLAKREPGLDIDDEAVLQGLYPCHPNQPDLEHSYSIFIRWMIKWLQNAATLINSKEDRIREKEDMIKEKEDMIKEKEDRVGDLKDRVGDMKDTFVDMKDMLKDARARPIPAYHWGSVTRSAMWESLVENRKADCDTTEPPITVESDDAIPLREGVDSIVTGNKWTCEADMYPPTRSLLSKRSNLPGDPVSHVVDTHAAGVFRADISVSIYPDLVKVLYGLYYFIELKYKQSGLDAPENCGQVVDYCHQMRAAQPYRTEFVAILSNFETTFIFVATYTRQDFSINKKIAHSLADAIIYAEKLSRDQLTRRVPTIETSILSESDGYKFLATTHTSFVLSLPMPKHTNSKATVTGWRSPSRFTRGKCFALKIKDDGNVAHSSMKIKAEVNILTTLNKGPGTSDHIPEIVWSSETGRQVGIVPVGRPIDFQQSETASRKIVEGLISGLQFIHGRDIVHRDIRPSNLVLDDEGKLVIIDYETALPVTQEGVEFEGGFICWPKRLLESNAERYVPKKSDDLRAAILLVLHLLFPSRFNSFYASNVRLAKGGKRTDETENLLALWSKIEESTVWSGFVRAADEENYDELLKMSGVFCHL